MDYLDNPKKKPKLQGRPVLRRIDADFDRRSQLETRVETLAAELVVASQKAAGAEARAQQSDAERRQLVEQSGKDRSAAEGREAALRADLIAAQKRLLGSE